jgi:1,4-alpha-glucan branching enzyme
MPARQDHVNDRTPMGANLVPGGCTFRAWAPRAKAVYVGCPVGEGTPPEEARLVPLGGGHWGGFLPGVADGAEYKFYVHGEGSTGWKRDPYARQLSLTPDYPRSNCVVRAAAYPWHDQGFRPPAFNDLVVYQFHVGRFYAAGDDGSERRPGRAATFLDVLDRVAYLADLGVNAVEPLPVVEFPHDVSLGYNGVDYFAPELA